jgi:hypothetical protein
MLITITVRTRAIVATIYLVHIIIVCPRILGPHEEIALVAGGDFLNARGGSRNFDMAAGKVGLRNALHRSMCIIQTSGQRNWAAFFLIGIAGGSVEAFDAS